MRAAGGVVIDLAEAIGAEARGGLRLFLGLSLAVQLVDGLDENEDADGDHQEVEHRLQEGTIGDLSGVLASAKGDGQRGEIDAAGDEREKAA